MAGAIKHSERVHVRSKQSAWYDHNYYVYPFSGEFDWGAMHAALRAKYNGQFSSIGDVELVAPGYIEVEHIYHLGD